MQSATSAAPTASATPPAPPGTGEKPSTNSRSSSPAGSASPEKNNRHDHLHNQADSPGYSYTYDADGNITSLDANLPGNPASGVSLYEYDNAGRLASWTKPDSTSVSYGYDDSGNLVNNAGATAVFDARNQLQTTGSATYQWTPRGTLTSVTDAGITTTSTFDGLNRNTSTSGTTLTYDSLDRVATNGSVVFAYAGDEIDPVAIGATRFTRSPAGIPLTAQTGTDPAVLLGRNTHGDIGYQHTADGLVTATRTYGPLGDVIGETGALTELGYQGDYTDPATGDVWMGARWYRPGTGTFTNRDTVFGHLQTPISLNRYTYAYGDPLGMFDPDGREPGCGGTEFSGTSCRDSHTAAAEQAIPAVLPVDDCSRCTITERSEEVSIGVVNRDRYDSLGEYDRWEFAKLEHDVCDGGGLTENPNGTRELYGSDAYDGCAFWHAQYRALGGDKCSVDLWGGKCFSVDLGRHAVWENKEIILGFAIVGAVAVVAAPTIAAAAAQSAWSAAVAGGTSSVLIGATVRAAGVVLGGGSQTDAFVAGFDPQAAAVDFLVGAIISGLFHIATPQFEPMANPGTPPAAATSRPGRSATEAATSTRVVIGGMEDLGPGSLRAGEETLASRLPGDTGSRLGNWLNNRDVLRAAMQEGAPIRDASVDSAGNLLYEDTRRFITMERDYLRSFNWTYDPSTNLWMPPG